MKKDTVIIYCSLYMRYTHCIGIISLHNDHKFDRGRMGTSTFWFSQYSRSEKEEYKSKFIKKTPDTNVYIYS